jgi:MFS family permease
VGSLAALLLLAGHGPPASLGWRLAFGIGGALGFGVLLLRLAVPESPRWLMLRGHEQEADRVVSGIEDRVKRTAGKLPVPEGPKLKLKTRDHTPWREIFRNMLGANRARSFLGLVLMVGQAFFFNAVFFTFGLMTKRFFHLDDAELPLQLLPFAVGSFLGPIMLGPLFDKVGRKTMITATYGAAGLLLAGVAFFFARGSLGLHGIKVCFSIIFFIASSAASAAYLTVSEIFPLEIRAFAIAMFYAMGTLVGGVAAPLLFGFLIASGSAVELAAGYYLGAALMVAGAVCEHLFGVEAAGQSLESISKPLQSQ